MTRSELPRGSLSRAWMFVALAFVLLATLPPQPHWPQSHGQFFSTLLPRTLGGWFDVAQNLALYAPFGFVLAARRHSAFLACVTAAFVSFGTELLQFLIPGRSPAARDVLVNTAGALLAYLIWRTSLGRAVERALRGIEDGFARGRQPDRRRASRLSLVWATGVTATLVVTAVLLAPAPPRSDWWIATPYLDREPGPVRIGGNGLRGGTFKGLIDEVRIFDHTRPAEAIRGDMLRPAAETVAGDDAPIAAFGFDGQAGAVARDETGHGHDGAITGAVRAPSGRFGGALYFDGVSSVVEVPHAPSLDLHDEMTLEAWVRPSPDSAGEPAVISRAGNLYYIDESSALGRNHAAAGGRFGEVPRYARLLEPIPPDEWTHLASTYDGQVISLYVNGELAASKVHWAPHRPERVRLNGVDIAAGRVADPDAMRAYLLGRISLEADLACGQDSSVPAPVFLIVALQDTDVLALEAAGADLIVRPWTWARSLHLASPPARIAGALSGCTPGRKVDLALQGHLQNPEASRDGRVLSASSAGLGSGWAFVIHAELLPAWLRVATTAGWLAFLTAPLGYWARRTVLTAGALLLVATACVMTPRVLHVRTADATELAGLVAGAAAGALCRRATHAGGYARSRASAGAG